MTPAPFLAIAGALLALAMVCTTVLVALDKLNGDAYMLGVVTPIVAGLVGAFAAIKGVQSGSEATASPPPST